MGISRLFVECFKYTQCVSKKMVQAENIFFLYYEVQSQPNYVWYFLKANKTYFLEQFFFISFDGVDLEIWVILSNEKSILRLYVSMALCIGFVHYCTLPLNHATLKSLKTFVMIQWARIMNSKECKFLLSYNSSSWKDTKLKQKTLNPTNN